MTYRFYTVGQFTEGGWEESCKGEDHTREVQQEHLVMMHPFLGDGEEE